MGRLYEYNPALDEALPDKYTVRVPIRMVQLTEKDGRAWPLAFDWHESDGESTRVKIDNVITVTPAAERKSGAVGDCYECRIKGRVEYLYYSKIHPRKWFIIQEVTKAEYQKYYKLPGESTK